MDQGTRLEERVAHLIRALDEMSDVVRAQADRLARLERTVEALVARELEREADAQGAPPDPNQRPPHW